MAGRKWWDATPEPGNPELDRDRATALVQETASIEMRQSQWHEFNLWNGTLYANRELAGFRWGNLAADQELFPSNLRTENLVQSVGDSMLSKASSQPLIPSPVPHGSSYKTEKAVRKLGKFIAGAWRLTEAEDKAVGAFLDAYISDLGAVRVDYDDDGLCVESIFFDNIIVDNRECANRAPPKTIRIRTVMPRAAVEARYGQPIDDGPQTRHYIDYREVALEWVVVVEAWRLPDPDGKNGRHTIACNGKLLGDEAWKHNWTNVVFFHWSDPVSGFFGRSGVEQCIPYQLHHNALNDAIELTQDICCRPRILAHAGSNLDINQWDNEFGRILGYTGTAPVPFKWDTDLVELNNERERNRSACYSYFGLSEMTANADLPQGVRLDSSAGVREFKMMEDSRHLRLFTRFEKFRLEIARRMLDVLTHSKKTNKYKVGYQNSKRSPMSIISWDEVKDLEQDCYSWSLEAVPLSSMSPAGRRELLRDWTSRGLIDSNEERRMVSHPDLEHIEDMEVSSMEDIDRHLELIEDGEYEAPSELTNLVYGLPRVTQNLHRLRRYTDVKASVIRNHQKWLLAGMAIQKRAAQAQMQQQQAMMAQGQQPQPGFDPAQGVQGVIA